MASSVGPADVTTATPTPTIGLFDDFKRIHPGRSDKLHESDFDYLNRSARPRAVEARDLCERWFSVYSRSATEDNLKDLRSRFRNRRLTQHHPAWFELLTHQVLVRLGFRVEIHPTVSGSNNKPDFAATLHGSCTYVEATAAGVRHALPHFEEDAMQKLADLTSESFYVCIEGTAGRLHRLLARDELLRPFKQFLKSHNPDGVLLGIEVSGENARPRCTISFDEWELSVALFVASPGHRRLRDNIVSLLQRPRNYTYVPDARKSIDEKLREYRRIEDTLVLAVTVYNLWDVHLNSVARDTVFGKSGIWDPNRSPGKNAVAVLFFSNSRPHAIPEIRACLCVNPLVDPATLPLALLRLPHIHGSKGSIAVEGESVASIVGHA